MCNVPLLYTFITAEIFSQFYVDRIYLKLIDASYMYRFRRLKIITVSVSQAARIYSRAGQHVTMVTWTRIVQRQVITRQRSSARWRLKACVIPISKEMKFDPSHSIKAFSLICVQCFKYTASCGLLSTDDFLFSSTGGCLDRYHILGACRRRGKESRNTAEQPLW